MASAPCRSEYLLRWSRDKGALTGTPGAAQRTDRGETLCARGSRQQSGVRPPAGDPKETSSRDLGLSGEVLEGALSCGLHLGYIAGIDEDRLLARPLPETVLDCGACANLRRGSRWSLGTDPLFEGRNADLRASGLGGGVLGQAQIHST
ncbi:hypothetical protein NDU88_006283 [Pleurodeles waltl]|uniref:Uncharacterized protein n=1 Tax=Pleurodeles waltl TaxID=8319 RepID=A0AAV7UL24_PLEWA|nr:hypothetical protein NDU88_006283 [Pleurodeles waltl]